MLWFRGAFITAFSAMLPSVATFASEHYELTAMMVAENLPFPGETPLFFIEQNVKFQSVAIVSSCAPFPEGCKNPQLKARSIRHNSHNQYIWEFANLEQCSGSERQVKLLLSVVENINEPHKVMYDAGQHRVKSALAHSAEEFVNLVSPCLSKSYMTPPWDR